MRREENFLYTQAPSVIAVQCHLPLGGRLGLIPFSIMRRVAKSSDLTPPAKKAPTKRWMPFCWSWWRDSQPTLRWAVNTRDVWRSLAANAYKAVSTKQLWRVAKSSNLTPPAKKGDRRKAITLFVGAGGEIPNPPAVGGQHARTCGGVLQQMHTRRFPPNNHGVLPRVRTVARIITKQKEPRQSRGSFCLELVERFELSTC